MVGVCGWCTVLVTAVAWYYPTKDRAERWIIQEREYARGVLGIDWQDHEGISVNGEESNETLERALHALQICIAALLAGGAIFAVVAVLLRGQRILVGPGLGILSWIALLQAGVLLAVRPVVLSSNLRQGRARISPDDSDDAWLRLFSAISVTGAALLEGSAFFFFIVYMLEGETWTLAAGIAMLALLAYWHFPTRDYVKRWLAEQREIVQTAENEH
jgi:hypothetical protein